MGEFDDVLAMEPGDEWDDHVIGEPPDAEAIHGELRATLRLPGVLVELRGDVPDDVVAELADLTDPGLELLGEAAVVQLSVARDGDGWALGGHGGPHAVPAGGEALLRALVARLDRLAVDTDPMRLHLDVGAVRLGDAGIVVVDARGRTPERPTATLDPRGPADGDPAVRDDRALVVADLLELGAAFLTADLLSLLPGSRTVFGHPAPPSTSTHPPVRASTVAPVAHVARIDHVVVLRRIGGGDGPTAIELDPAAAAVQLVLAARDADRIGPAALEVVAHAIGGARCTLVDHGDPGTVAALVAALPPPAHRPMVVAHRFDGPVDDAPEPLAGAEPIAAPVRAGRRSKRVVRLGRTGALCDGASGLLTTLEPDELDALEGLLVPPSTASAAAGVVPERLAAAGVRLPRAGAIHVPGVEAYGLPNCPAGAVATALWSPAPTGALLGAEGSSPAEVPAALAQAIERGVIESPSEQGAILDRHELARRLTAAVETTLHDVLAVAEQHSVVPLVIGRSVLAHDGWLPADFTDADRVELLVEPDGLPTLATALTEVGFDRVDPSPSDEATASGDVRLVRRSDPPVPVRLRTNLAVGPFAALVNHQELHERSVPVRLGGRWCRALHPEDRFVLTCVQLDRDAAGATVQDLRDVVLSAPRIEAHMAESLEASERWGATLGVLAALRRVHASMPGLSPWLVERAERSDRPRGQAKPSRAPRMLRRRRR